ncbi:SRPBCC family protein [Streptosporangiaceae bacterium NEAU-GS5]|nr:SRPBCC family protein [Streptosporangiaceae bacterium NEAU-GS5]
MAKTQITATPGSSQIIMTREFTAPRDLVFRAYTEPDLLAQWLGPRELTLRVEEFDLRDGGKWRYVHVDADGNEFAFRGIFHGTPTPDGTVQTFEFEGMPGHVALETLTLEEHDGRTVARTVSCFQSVEDRDGMIASGMEHGVHDSDERMEELLARLQQG